VSSIAALPMYDLPELRESHDRLWLSLRKYLTDAGLKETPAQLTHNIDPVETWTHPGLVLGQGCQYPLAKFFAERVRLVATPRYAAHGCEEARYRSAIVVREDDPAETLADLRGRRCAVNERSSNSGMNLLRAAIAPLANGARFFESVVLSGSHRGSVKMVSAGDADVAAVDCVSLAHFQRLYPATTTTLRILAWTPTAPSLPLITSGTTNDEALGKLRSSLAAAISDPDLDDAREQLLLEGFDLEPAEDYGEVLQLERSAAQQGYPKLF
jgi:ABC-type phosphate/phosphonate transport system substrate-binding protein